MKRFFAILLVLTCLCGCLCLTACSGKSLGDYYGKTLTITGKALPLNWKTACYLDVGPDNPNLANQKEYSVRQLLDKYWDRLDIENENGGFSGLGITSVDGLISYVNSHLDNVYDGFKGMSFAIGAKDDQKVTITLPTDTGNKVINALRVESAEEFAAVKSKIGGDNYMLKEESVSTVGLDPGKYCLCLFDWDEDGFYDSALKIVYTAYIVNDSAPTVEFEFYFFDGVDEYNNAIVQTVGVMDIKDVASVYFKDGMNNMTIIPLLPEIAETATAAK